MLCEINFLVFGFCFDFGIDQLMGNFTKFNETSQKTFNIHTQNMIPLLIKTL
jgi:hypothetical protein